jgi:hypothetical protein
VAADLLAEDAVGAADVAGALRRDRRCLEAEAVLADGPRRLVHDLVLGRPPGLERQVVAGQVELEADDVRSNGPKGLLEQLLPGVVAFQDNNCP